MLICHKQLLSFTTYFGSHASSCVIFFILKRHIVPVSFSLWLRTPVQITVIAKNMEQNKNSGDKFNKVHARNIEAAKKLVESYVSSSEDEEEVELDEKTILGECSFLQ